MSTESSKLCKIVYFDEDSVTDYIQIVAGGQSTKTSEVVEQTSEGGKAAAKVDVGFGASLKAILKVKANIGADAELHTASESNDITKNIVTNTILTDFVDVISDESISKQHKSIKKFCSYAITAPKDSFSYVVLLTPYLSMVKGSSTLSAGDINIAMEKMDAAIKAAKGYYEFVGTNGEGKQVIFRFNIKSFRNNYRIADLLKMDTVIYAIRVGKSSIDKLNIQNELDVQAESKDNPDYKKAPKPNDPKKTAAPLEVYDVMLAGVEYND